LDTRTGGEGKRTSRLPACLPAAGGGSGGYGEKCDAVGEREEEGKAGLNRRW